MPRYETVKEYFGGDATLNDGVINQNPYWVLCVVGLNKVLSYSRADKASVVPKSEGGKARIKLVIANDCVTLSINNSKNSHTKSLQATLRQGSLNYLQKIFTGDWIMAWCVNSKSARDVLITKITNGQPCNKFNDGFKFVGRVDSFRKNGSLTPDGIQQITYSIGAFGFRELDTTLFYDINLADNVLLASGTASTWLMRIGLQVRDLFGEVQDGIVPNNCRHLIGSLLKIMIGRGIPSSALNHDTSIGTAALGGQTDKEAPYAYLVPQEVGNLLGKSSQLPPLLSTTGLVSVNSAFEPSKTSGLMSYADLLEFYSGVQKYQNNDASGYAAFVPYVSSTDGIESFSGDEPLGTYPPNFVDFTNKPLWSILEQYKNGNINEMYTCLRVNPQGDVVPQIIFRQIPFTSPTFATILGEELYGVSSMQSPSTSSVTANNAEYNHDADSSISLSNSQIASINAAAATATAAQNYNRLKVTPFHNLPRWVLDDIMVRNYNFGRSDATRTNFVHIYGQSATQGNAAVPISYQMVNNPPIMDQLDIQRSGLHAYQSTVACFNIDQVGKTPTAWMELVSDFMIGSQNTLNGTIQCTGISAPICEGDNVEWAGLLFHIEAITHTCSLDPSGNSEFSTILTLTNGVLASGFDPSADTDPFNSFYPALGYDPTLDQDPGTSVETDQ